MTARLTRLRIAGFKSFAEPVSLDILPGLTGIVGPNGCGKSNVVEALRWAMGETSARSLRGGEMDDVIFAGTTVRPSRNLAEVTITLERAGEAALPAPFEAEQEVQLTRRIERGAGSGYRGNGREMRARDVQTMFADLASGARSSAMVSQGRVAAIVNARPDERRQILEEAAGITGLHARRHEAELKLRAAEQNLAKAEDLRTQLEATRDGLRKQAKQAARYRNISALLRDAEADVLAVQHALACNAAEAARLAHAAARDAVVEAERACARAAGQVEAAEAAVPAPRTAEAAARSALERARLEAENLAQEAARADAALADAAQRMADLRADADDAARMDADAAAACGRIADEAAALQARIALLPEEIEACRAHAADAENRAQAASLAAEQSMRDAAAASAAALQARRALDAATRRAEVARADLRQAEEAHGVALAALVGESALADSAGRVEGAEQALGAARQAALAAGQAEAFAARGMADAVAAHDQAKAEALNASRLAAEAGARAEKIAASHARLCAALAEAEAALVPEAALRQARDAASAAAVRLERAEQAVQAAEHASMAAAHDRLRADRHACDLAEDVQRAAAGRDSAVARLSRVTAERDSLAATLADAHAALIGERELVDAAQAARRAEAEAAAAAGMLHQAADHREAAERRLGTARAEAAAAVAEAGRLAAEIAGLRAALESHGDGAPAALDSLEVPAELEAAFGAALDDAREFSTTPDATKFWRLLPDLPDAAAHAGTTPLAHLIGAPDCFRRALSRIAVLDDGADGDALHAALAPGDTLVSRAGAVWRWDGRVTRAGAPHAAAARLRQRRRLREVEAGAAEARARAMLAAAAEQDAVSDLSTKAADYAAARAAQAAAEQALRAASEAQAGLTAAAEQATARHAALLPGMARLAAECEAAADALAQAAAVCASLGSPAAAQDAARDAAARAAAAAAALDQARAERLAARGSLAACDGSLRDMELAATEAASRTANLLEQVAREDDAVQAAQTALAEARMRVAALPDVAALDRAAEAARQLLAEAQAHARACQTAQMAAQAALDSARASAASLDTARVQAETRLAAQAERVARARADDQAAMNAVSEAEATVRTLADPAEAADRAAAANTAASDCRTALAGALSRLAGLEGELSRVEMRMGSLAAEQADWQQRHAQAARRRAAVAARLEAADLAWRELSQGPALLAGRAERSASVLAEAEAAHTAQAALLADAEAALRRAGLAQRDTDARLAGVREALVRTESAEAAAQAALHGVLSRTLERLGPEAVLADMPDASAAAEDRARRKWERLQREREEMGPVNLRADLELEEIDGRLEGIDRDREELTTAIAKLRGAIGHLNREGRERLSAVFTDVDRHFRALFTRMMGGGRAHLALTGSDDPLLAGLEIYAEPPGKKLSTLSLLSGGEQALTALSLIFAVFRCTPAPVAVLDEVDAPLDDANVGRFCALLEDVVRETGTRFLVVTHHQVTMSRMDRLFGVTMQERGVSRLLSVDLRRASEMVEAVPQAEAA
jgi:chromosome segregation protein